MSFTPQNMLVTGGAGFIGSNFVHYVLEKSDSVRVINLDAMTYAADRRNLEGLPSPERHSLVEGDITDRELLNRIFREHDIDCVVHFAAESHVDRSITGPETFVRTNVLGTFQLLEAARQIWTESSGLDVEKVRFHHISTDEVYGTLKEDAAAFTEKTPYAPNSPYSASKAGADHLVRSYFKTYGMPVTTSNCSNNYGPRQNPEKLIPKVIQSCLSGSEIPVYGDGRNIRDWLYVEDHCEAILQIIKDGTVGSTYNIGGDEEQRNIELIREICAVMDKVHPSGKPHEQLMQFVVDRLGHDWRYAIDFSLVESTLGWKPRHSFQQGIQATVEWYLQ